MPLERGMISAAAQRFQTAQRILVVSHIRPDGDAIGSLLGLGLALEKVGKEVQMVLNDGVPAPFRHLPGSERVQTKPSGAFDLKVVLDCSDQKRVGNALNGYGKPDINIDHHVTNLLYARLNLVDPAAAATAEILTGLLPKFGLPLDQDIASCLLTGVVTDTLGFRTNNMTPEVLRVAAQLMETGADLPDLYRRALISRSYEAARFWGAGLSRLEREGRIVWTALSQSDRDEAGYPGRDDADLVNILSAIEEADIAIIFVEQPNLHTKVSWRSVPGVDVSQIALEFGGGGHPSASGADVPGTLEEVIPKVLDRTQEYLEKQKSANLA